MKAAIYSRFSTDRQTDSSIADQVRVCTEYATREAMQVVELFEDQGISGAAIGNRPSVIRMREAALARRFDVLLVMDLSRLSRSQADLPKLIDQLAAKGVRVIGVQDGYDSSRRGHKLQAGLHGILGEAFREMVKDRTYAALESRAKSQRSTGGRAYGYLAASQTDSGSIEVNEREASVVREIFQRYADGASCLAIAGELNARGIPSPGATWNRTQRRAGGWMISGLRSMLRNPLYKGDVIWNTSEWRKDPDSGKRTRIMRPESEWIRHQDERLRLVSNDLWRAAQRPARKHNEPAQCGKQKVAYVLSGLLKCSECGTAMVMADARSYSCSSNRYGRACSNNTRISRKEAERILLQPLRDQLTAPERVQSMVREMHREMQRRLSERQQTAARIPKGLQELDDRIARLRNRLRDGDPDLSADELQGAIERAEAKRQDLSAAATGEKDWSKLLTLVPKAAERYARQVDEGLSGKDWRTALKARAFLRSWFGNEIRVVPDAQGAVWAEFAAQPAALLRTLDGYGSGGRI